MRYGVLTFENDMVPIGCQGGEDELAKKSAPIVLDLPPRRPLRCRRPHAIGSIDADVGVALLHAHVQLVGNGLPADGPLAVACLDGHAEVSMTKLAKGRLGRRGIAFSGYLRRRS